MEWKGFRVKTLSSNHHNNNSHKNNNNNNNNNKKKKKKKKNDALAGCATGALGIHTYLHTYLQVEK